MARDVRIVFMFIISVTVVNLHFTDSHASITFDRATIDETGPTDPHAKAVGDIDGDGNVDLLVASSANGPLVWYEYPQWTKHVIAPSGRWSTDAEVGDIDNDGDNDVIISDWYINRRMEWYEHPGPDGDPTTDLWILHVIGSPRAHDIELGDLDNDGDLDIITRQQNSLGNKLEIWLQESGLTWNHRTIAISSGEGLSLGDIDRDGDPDAVIGGYWYETPTDLISGSFTEHPFSVSWDYENTVVALADMNQDGRLDVILTPSESAGGTYRVSWFEAPPDPHERNWTEFIIEEETETAIHSLGVADLDNDGDLDVVTAEMHQSEDPDEVTIHINDDNHGATWTKIVIAVTGSHNMRVIDIGEDGTYDLFGVNWDGPYQPVELWVNTSPVGVETQKSSWGNLKSQFR